MFLMANGVNAVFSGFESSYHQQLNRNFIKQYIYAFGVAIILVFLLIMTVIGFGYAQIYLIPPILDKFSTGDVINELFWITRAKYFFFVLMTYLSMATLYYFGTKDGKLSSFFSIGALFTTFLILLTSYLFGLYIEKFSTYNELYGSIGALLILLFYFWLNANIILLGHELNSSLQLLKKKCTHRPSILLMSYYRYLWNVILRMPLQQLKPNLLNLDFESQFLLENVRFTQVSFIKFIRRRPQHMKQNRFIVFWMLLPL